MSPISSNNLQPTPTQALVGIVERVTFHNPENGWSVLKVAPFRQGNKTGKLLASELVTVVIHQAQVFAGATMQFVGEWTKHPKHGEQFRAHQAIERKPASTAALEKYLGSGLIHGVGPVTARRIVEHFKEDTLRVFEEEIDKLMRVPGIAEKKLEQIRKSWVEHRAIRDVMMFLQKFGISTLFAVKIYKTYGDKSIDIVSQNPYRLSRDIYGIGFFSADRVALAMGYARNGEARVDAGIQHVLSASREAGHCYLTEEQILEQTLTLLNTQNTANNNNPENIADMETTLVTSEQVQVRLEFLLNQDHIKLRVLKKSSQQANEDEDTELLRPERCFYSKTLFFDERTVAQKVLALSDQQIPIDRTRVEDWVNRYCQKHGIQLSDEQKESVVGISEQGFSILTGGPGCGKTTTTRVLVQLMRAMNKKILLAAPTGRAAQRMSDVIGLEAKTLHRLLEWTPQSAGFKKGEDDPLEVEALIVDECSMLDVSLASSLLKAVPVGCQVLFIGDPDQLPAVGAGNVLQDLLRSRVIKTFRLTQVFRQAKQSHIIERAHEINRGYIPKIPSPLAEPTAFTINGVDCLFVDSEEATVEQLKFLERTRNIIRETSTRGLEHYLRIGDDWRGALVREEASGQVQLIQDFFPEEVSEQEVKAPVFEIPPEFAHVRFDQLIAAQHGNHDGQKSYQTDRIAELIAIFKKVHPWSSLHYGMTALDMLQHLYNKTIPQWLSHISSSSAQSHHDTANCEIQVLTPQVRGSVGSLSINQHLQESSNPSSPGKTEMRLGERLFRQGDRVIQTRNNYDLGVFNGDIGTISSIDLEDQVCEVRFTAGGGESRSVIFEREHLFDLQLAYAITIHKSQGSEFQAVILPVLSQHFNMLFRNLIYTGLTRAKKLAVFIGSRKALAMAIRRIDNRKRQTALEELVRTGRY